MPNFVWGLLIMLVLLLPIFFLPIIVAKVNHNPRMNSVFWLNVLFGWSLLGWLVALFVALETPGKRR